jgi:NTP pyrophosphatase (non-canonical NTP hydrolase)
VKPLEAQCVLLAAPLPTACALAAVAAERERVVRLHAHHRLPGVDCANPLARHSAKLAVLVEEVGEVAQQINEGTISTKSRNHLRTELIQVAAVAVAWAESLDERNPKPETNKCRHGKDLSTICNECDDDRAYEASSRTSRS